MEGGTANGVQDLLGVKPNIKDSYSQASMEFAKATPVTMVSSTSKEDFATFLWKLLNNCMIDWKTARTCKGILTSPELQTLSPVVSGLQTPFPTLDSIS
jgi:hypothetical protein